MVCFTTCALAMGFIGASISIMINTHQRYLNSKFVEMLDDNQRNTYQTIVNEQFRYYTQGTIIGLLLSAVYFYIAKRNGAQPQTIICSVIAIIGIVQYLYYKLMPKSQWVLSILTTKDQVAQWLEIYKYMSWQYHMGFALGIIGYAILTWANI